MSSPETHDQPADADTAMALRWLLGTPIFLIALFGIDVVAWLVSGKPAALAPTVMLDAWWLEAMHLMHLVLALAVGVFLAAAGFWVPWLAGGFALRSYRALCHR